MIQNAGKLAGKTVFVTGASRGIGKAIALKAAKDKANIVIIAKTATAHAKLEGTIYTAAEEIEAAGGKCLPIQVDVREEEQVQKAVDEAVSKFGGIDILVNNASAISLTDTLNTPMKRYDLMNQINARGTFLTSKLCIPHLKKSKNPHIINMSPPLSMNPKWFQHHVAYTMAKYGMSMCVLGMAEEFREDGIAVNALWPRTAIWTAAMGMLAGDEGAKSCRTVDICADAFYVMATKDSRQFTGNFVIDERILRQHGVKDFDVYAVEPGHPLMLDGFIDDDSGEGNVVGGVGIGEKNAPPDAKVSKKAGASANIGDGSPSAIFEKVQQTLQSSSDVKLPGVFCFDVEGEKWYLDGDNRTVSQDAPSGDPTVTLTMKTPDFVKMFTGELLPANAFMSGKIKIKGNMGAALKLDKLLSSFVKQGKKASL